MANFKRERERERVKPAQI